MKVRTLQFGKALNAALFVLLLSVAGMKNALAQTLVATLKHGDEISFYYGANALVDAHEDAETGDIITLSSGTFAPTEITKAITLRGAGCVEDTISGVHPTEIQGEMVFNVGDTVNYMTVEGIYFSGEGWNGKQCFKELYNPRFIKCNFANYTCYPYYEGYSNNALFTNCMFKMFSFLHTNNTTLLNCVVWGVQETWEADVTVFNSIVRLSSSVRNWIVYNCILIGNGTLYEYCTAYNCIGINNPFNSSISTYNCIEVGGYQDVFETFEGFTENILDFEEPFILKEEIATGFLGDDGTEVGIHGGYMPYDPRPSYQIVRHYSVPKKSDNEGHLNVEIEVYTEEGE